MSVAPQAYAVRWRDANRWDIKAARATQFRLAHPHFRPLAHFAEEATVTVNPRAKPEHEWPVYGVNNSTGVFLSHRQRGADFNSAYKRIEKDWFFHNPTRANVGSLGRVPNVPNDAITSPEYQVWRLTGQLIPTFVEILIRTRYFLEMIDCHRVGAVKERLFVSNLLEIPVPDINERQQHTVVAAFEKAKARAAALRSKADEIDAVAEAEFLKILGLTPPAKRALPKVLAIPWSDAERWSVLFHQIAAIAVDLDSGKYAPRPLGSLLTLVQYGSSQKADRTGRGTPIIRMNNIVDGVFDLSDLKYVQLSNSETESLLLERNDIVINRTNSKELVGKCAVFEAEGAFVFASYLIRLRADTDQADPAFLAYVINGSIGRGQIDQVSRQIGGQANINTDEIRALRIPCPDPDEQRLLMKPVLAARKETTSLRQRAVQAEQAALDQAEEMILGRSRKANADGNDTPASAPVMAAASSGIRRSQ